MQHLVVISENVTCYSTNREHQNVNRNYTTNILQIILIDQYKFCDFCGRII